MPRGDRFDLTLSLEDGRVLASAAWQGRRARGPLGRDLESIRASASCGPATRGLRGVRRRTSRTPHALAPQQLGELLFTALPEKVRHLWELARQHCGAAGTRLRLQLSADSGLADLPWELLCEPGGAFVAASTETAFSRCVEPTRPVPPTRPATGPLRILIFVASPADLEPLDADDEIARIRQALADRHVRIELVPGGDRETLFRSLQGRRTTLRCAFRSPRCADGLSRLRWPV